MIGAAVAPFSFIPSTESRELADDVRQLFDELASSLSYDRRAFSGEYRPALDVRETDEAVEITVDVSGVSGEAIRVLFRAGVVLVAGEKAPTRPAPDQAYHLVEREFGRFARAVRVTGAVDVAGARATLARGELTILLPKAPERRGRAYRIAVVSQQDGEGP
jgi:HSP20 family protein